MKSSSQILIEVLVGVNIFFFCLDLFEQLVQQTFTYEIAPLVPFQQTFAAAIYLLIVMSCLSLTISLIELIRAITRLNLRLIGRQLIYSVLAIFVPFLICWLQQLMTL